MFLSPSPPRVTRRSRLDNWLLLLLRAAILGLLALAFARPFLRESAKLDDDSLPGQRIALLVDTSASMRRDDLWRQAVAKVEEAVADAAPADQVAVFTFDRDIKPLVSFEEWTRVPPGERAALTRARLQDASPSWNATNLSDALAAAADLLERREEHAAAPAAQTRRVVVVSDLSSGANLNSLNAYQWPADVGLITHRVKPQNQDNANLRILSTQPDMEAGQKPHWRVRVSNAADSRVDRFQLSWASATGAPTAAGGVDVYVPAGSSRVVRAPVADAIQPAPRLTLTGDAQPFDNTFYIVPPRREEITVAFIGEDPPGDPGGLLYYLQRAYSDSPWRSVHLTQVSPAGPPLAASQRELRLVVVDAALPADHLAALRQYVTAGGTALFVLKDNAPAASLSALLGADDMVCEEAALEDYAMLEEIDFSHPLFADFADPRFNDFTKIHFWKHRQLNFGQKLKLKTLARFDNGAPALCEQSLQRGAVFVLASGWHPSDSQLALSSKFVPLLEGLIQDSAGAELTWRDLEIGDSLPPLAAKRQSGEKDEPIEWMLRKPDGSQRKLGDASAASVRLDQPGVYTLTSANGERRFAVNLDAAESQTSPLDLDQLRQRGVRLAEQETKSERLERRRQMRDVELESRQKLWRWLIVVGLVAIMAETILASRKSLRAASET